jgi:protein OS-9
VALGSNVAAVPLSAGEHAALAGDDPSAVMMTAHDGQRYFCALPRQSRDADGGSDASGGANEGTGARNASEIEQEAPTVDDVLKPLTNRCFYRIEGWWTYELCHMKKIRQYHQEDKKVTNEYNLGVFHAEETESIAESRRNDESATPPGGAPPYHAHVFTEGTPCDLTDLKRQTEVRLTCAPNGVNVIVGIEEPSTCRYVFTFQTPELCKRSEFRAPTKETSHIRCKAVADGVDTGGDTPGTVRGKSFSVPSKKTEL